jgi:hypothetical protein
MAAPTPTIPARMTQATVSPQLLIQDRNINSAPVKGMMRDKIPIIKRNRPRYFTDFV